MMNKIYDIIPITFNGGTGGHFLAWFVNLAYLNDVTLMNFSVHGNAHGNDFKYHGSNNTVNVPDIKKINEVIDQKLTRFPNNVWFPNIHLADLDLARSTFQKNIRITYECNDIPELLNVVTGKVFKDLMFATDQQIGIFRIGKENQLKNYQPLFTKTDYSDVCYITWKELLYGSENQLIQSLSDYTSIPLNNFNSNNLHNWRKKTIESIETMNKYNQRSEYGLQ